MEAILLENQRLHQENEKLYQFIVTMKDDQSNFQCRIIQDKDAQLANFELYITKVRDDVRQLQTQITQNREDEIQRYNNLNNTINNFMSAQIKQKSEETTHI
jgi:hypothetical protein